MRSKTRHNRRLLELATRTVPSQLLFHKTVKSRKNPSVAVAQNPNLNVISERNYVLGNNLHHEIKLEIPLAKTSKT